MWDKSSIELSSQVFNGGSFFFSLFIGFNHVRQNDPSAIEDLEATTAIDTSKEKAVLPWNLNPEDRQAFDHLEIIWIKEVLQIFPENLLK